MGYLKDSEREIHDFQVRDEVRHVIQQSRWLKSILCSTPWGAEADRQGVLGDKESEEFERRLQPKAKGEPAVGSI